MKIIFSKSYQTSNFKENLPVGGEFFCADIRRVGQREGGTEMTKLIVNFGIL